LKPLNSFSTIQPYRTNNSPTNTCNKSPATSSTKNNSETFKQQTDLDEASSSDGHLAPLSVSILLFVTTVAVSGRALEASQCLSEFCHLLWALQSVH
jgi:hypothetical protein